MCMHLKIIFRLVRRLFDLYRQDLKRLRDSDTGNVSIGINQCFRCTQLPCLVTIISLVCLRNWRHLCLSWSLVAATGSRAGIPDAAAMVSDADAGLYILRYLSAQTYDLH